MSNAVKIRIKEYIDNNLSEKRKIHTYAVADEARKLAKRYGVDPDKAELSALFHDMYRGRPIECLDRLVHEFGLDPRYLGNSNLSHGKVAALVMKRDFGIEDQEIIDAVSYHTTGRSGMSDLEKVIYLADTIEPGRNYPGVEQLRQAAYKNLNEACLMALSRSIDYIDSRGLKLDNDTAQAKRYLTEEKERRAHE